MDPLELIAQADKKAKPSSGLFSFLGSSSNYHYEEAADLYTQAANQYKLQKNFVQSGKVFEKAAASYLKASSPDEAAASLVEAYKVYKAGSPKDAARCLTKAIEHFTSKGQFRRGASYKTELAELYLTLGEKENAIKAFDDAGDWYYSDSAESLSNKNFLRSADLKAELGQYVEASRVYETIAERSVANTYTKWSSKDYFTKAILCRLAASDYSGAVNKLELFVQWDGSFSTTREYNFLSQILDGVKDRDQDAIGKACADYDQYSRLDAWKISILTKIKESLGGAGGLGGGDDLDGDDLT